MARTPSSIIAAAGKRGRPFDTEKLSTELKVLRKEEKELQKAQKQATAALAKANKSLEARTKRIGVIQEKLAKAA